MSEYPEDVMKAANEVVTKWKAGGTIVGLMPLIADAIMAERQRCADIVLNANALNADERYFLRQISRKIVSPPSSAASSFAGVAFVIDETVPDGSFKIVSASSSSVHRPSEREHDQRQRSCNGDEA